MSVINSSILAGASGDVAFTVEESCKFNNGSSGGKLEFTQGTPTGSKAFTYSFWFKGKSDMAGLNDDKDFSFLDSFSTDNDYISLGRLNGKFAFSLRGGTGDGGVLQTSELQHDPSSWYHMVVAVNTEESVAANRMRIYKNGTQITAFDTETYCAEDYVLQNFNTSGVDVKIGQESGSYPGGSYMAEANFIDGQQLTPSDFAETDSDTNQWIPKLYAGTYGDNGWRLKFEDSADLGNDSSGNGNDFTPSNLAADNQMLDGPSNNFCTLNELDTNDNGSWNGEMEEGNTHLSGTAGIAKSRSTFGVDNTNGTYVEVRWGAATDCNCGFMKFGTNNLTTSSQIGADPGYPESGYKGSTGVFDTDGSTEATYATSAEGQLLGFAFKNGYIYIGKIASAGAEATWFNSGDPSAGTGYLNASQKTDTDNWVFALGTSHYVNFGQDSTFSGQETVQANKDANGEGEFYGAVPSGFLSLCSNNLPEPSIKLPAAHFSTILYTGDGEDSRAITGVGFTPDMATATPRSTTGGRLAVDRVRGQLSSGQMARLNWNDTAGNQNTTNEFTSIDADGYTFSTTVGSGPSDLNIDTRTYVVWGWLAGGAPTATNVATSGVMTSGSVFIDGSSDTAFTPGGTVYPDKISANTTNGFSIVYVPTTGSALTFAHGLSQAPDFIFAKSVDKTDYWPVGATPMQANWGKYISFNSSPAWSTGSTVWNNTAPTASLVSIGTQNAFNNAGENTIFYCFHEIAGYSKVDKYTGNGNANGAFYYLGFKPAVLIIKGNNSSDWHIFDNTRIGYNSANYDIAISESAAETTAVELDLLSNGFKIRISDANINGNDIDFLIYSLAESPFKYSRGR